jgi:subtilisin family serine protease
MPFKHTISSTGFSNLFGYGMPDLIKALELDVGPLEINKLRTSQFNNNVALNALNALEAWQAGYTGSGVKVGVFDGGVGINTPEALLELPNAVLYRDAVDTVTSHGFRVSQYIVAKNQMPDSVGGTGQKSEIGSADERDVTGVAFDAEFYFASADLYSIGINVPNNEEAAFQWFVEQDVDVINWSGSLRYEPGMQFYRAIQLAHEKGIIIVVSAGNNAMGMDEGRNTDILLYANEFDNIVVASSTMPDTLDLYNYSNHAGDTEHNNFTVVEDYSYAFYPSGEYEQNINGTSFAAPYLTGVVALVIQKLRSEGKYDIEGDYREVIRLLKNSASMPSQSDVVINSDGTSTYDLTILVDAGILGESAAILNGITEIVEVIGGKIVRHSLEYANTEYAYEEVDKFIMTISRNGKFTNEFRDELRDFSPRASTIEYSDLLSIVGVENINETILRIASSDGFFVI